MPTLGGVPQGPSHRQCSGSVRVEPQVTSTRASVTTNSVKQRQLKLARRENIWREKEKAREC
jgi:hypothetical protein